VFYEEGVKFAFAQLGLTKEAGRWILPLAGAIGGAGKGALVGGGVGGLTGALSAEKGQGWEGFKRGLGRGALAGAAMGGVGGALRGRGLNRALGDQGVADMRSRMQAGTFAPEESKALGRIMAGGSLGKGLVGGIAGMTGHPEG
jgi:hypothetical protein